MTKTALAKNDNSRQPQAAGHRASSIPAVESVLRSPGQSLDPLTRSLAEDRFAHDFSQVRVHTDTRAGESARSVNAFAYTSGQHIAFAPGRYAPQTPDGMHLLTHELAHVVQQGRSSVVSDVPGVADDPHERQARAVADTAMGGGQVAGLLHSGLSAACPVLQRQPAPQPSPQPAPPPLNYDRSRYNIPLLSTGHTAASLRKLLNDKVTAGDITSFAVTKVTPGSNAEIFVLNVIWSLSGKDQWGKEADLVTAIDWPAKPTDPVPKGRVTLRIDTKGAATAELIATGPVPAVTQMTVAAASTKLRTDYGFSAVKNDGTAAWSAAELSDVAAALALLPTADKPALKGVELIRVKSLGAHAGEYSSGGAVVSGATAPSKPYLKLADEVFPATTLQFYGGSKGTSPESFQTILHEVGHAVEEEAYRAALGPYAQAIVDTNALVDPLNKAADALNAAIKVRGDLFAKYTNATGAAKEALRTKIVAQDATIASLRAVYDVKTDKYTKAETARDAKKAEVEKTKVSAATIQPLGTDAAAKKTSAATALTTAKAAVQALAADLVTSSATYAKAVDDTVTAIATFVTEAAAGKKSIDDLEQPVLTQVAARDKERDALTKAVPGHAALAALSPATAAQDAWLESERVFARARNRTLRLQKFIDLVTTNKIQRFTKYSAENWLLKPAEFYAEAYSLWRLDPEFLENNYKLVYDFFQSGDYRK